MYIVYLIENPKAQIYIGYTANLDHRLESHNMPSGPDWTQGKGPWQLIHTEQYDSKRIALQRERYLKSLKTGKKIKGILHIPDTRS